MRKEIILKYLVFKKIVILCYIFVFINNVYARPPVGSNPLDFDFSLYKADWAIVSEEVTKQWKALTIEQRKEIFIKAAFKALEYYEEAVEKYVQEAWLQRAFNTNINIADEVFDSFKISKYREWAREKYGPKAQKLFERLMRRGTSTAHNVLKARIAAQVAKNSTKVLAGLATAGWSLFVELADCKAMGNAEKVPFLRPQWWKDLPKSIQLKFDIIDIKFEKKIAQLELKNKSELIIDKRAELADLIRENDSDFGTDKIFALKNELEFLENRQKYLRFKLGYKTSGIAPPEIDGPFSTYYNYTYQEKIDDYQRQIDELPNVDLTERQEEALKKLMQDHFACEEQKVEFRLFCNQAERNEVPNEDGTGCEKLKCPEGQEPAAGTCVDQ